MRPLAFPLKADDTTPIGGLVQRLRVWIAALRPGVILPEPDMSAAIRMDDRRSHANCPAAVARAGSGDRLAKGAEIVAFPRVEQARLIGLARDLKQRLGDREPLQLCIEGGATPRLWIDSTAYVEFRGAQIGYRAVLDSVFETRLTMETLDFDSISDFVRYYVMARLTDARRAEVQS
ncbi:hypothetical protein [Bradyrhizobium sp. LHD-71]|uniref:hypothetical protein n=1 Tax=Bradyrhizobium sp. LHD-71 TaxID=3072141 RepID=UPI00280CF537|nr:hypothetical protein [Bradyrhizobium sp. LHD-71]MDQ8728090.1 hypothetical protein [Bradyrhizobium sp. LHD-71]